MVDQGKIKVLDKLKISLAPIVLNYRVAKKWWNSELLDELDEVYTALDATIKKLKE